MSLRRMGKAAFAHIMDESNRIQIYLRQDQVGDQAYELFKLLDIGDIVGAKGKVFKTRTGEITLLVSEITLLATAANCQRKGGRRGKGCIRCLFRHRTAI